MHRSRLQIAIDAIQVSAFYHAPCTSLLETSMTRVLTTSFPSIISRALCISSFIPFMTSFARSLFTLSAAVSSVYLVEHRLDQITHLPSFSLCPLVRLYSRLVAGLC